MGIPRLTSRLQHKAECTKWPRNNVSSADPGSPPTPSKIAIIDGPGLAYHIFHSFVKDVASNDAKLDLCLDYSSVSRRLLAFLDDLEHRGFHIQHIFFDGALPLVKTPTRLARLQHYAKQAVELKFSCEERAKKAGRSLQSYRTFLTNPWQNASWPPPPFLVPSLLEGLMNSKYAEITQVMSGEADHYCTVAARELASQGHNGAHIFTNDSDLLVLNSADDTKVVLLSSLAYEASDILVADVFNPTAIVKSLALTDLLEAAYRMKLDPHIGLDAAASSVLQGASQTTPGYKHFLEELHDTTIDVAFNTAQQRCFGRMDSKLSELLCQIAMKHTVGDLDNDPCVYLPFMIDDVQKASSWRCGADLRKLAYTVLTSRSTFTTIKEFDRRGDRVVACRVSLHTDLQQALHSYREWLSEQLLSIQAKDIQSPWRVIAAITLLCDLQAQDKSTPSLVDITTVVCTRKLYSWAQIHLMAQLNAVLYSFRLLKLALEFELAGNDQTWPGGGLRGLMDLFKNLPPLLELFELLQDQDRTAFSDLIRVHCAAEDSTSRTRKRPRRTVQALSDEQVVRRGDQSGALAGNPFAMLAE